MEDDFCGFSLNAEPFDGVCILFDLFCNCFCIGVFGESQDDCGVCDRADAGFGSDAFSAFDIGNEEEEFEEIEKEIEALESELSEEEE